MDFFQFLGLFGGLSFFLFGMKVMSGSLEKMAGGTLQSLLHKATAKPAVGLLLGAAITIAMQSSSATTVMLVGLVNSGLMQFSQTICVIFGANVGTTLTAWILSLSGVESSNFLLQLLKPQNFSPIFAFLGILLLLFSKSERKKNLGTVGVGFALLMYGMTLMSSSVSPLAEQPEFENFLSLFSNPILSLLVALLFTAVVQSSAASIGILQALSLTGKLTYEMVVPMVMGLNIGTCMTSIISCIGANVNAKRVAGVHVISKVIATVVFLPIFFLLSAVFDWTFVKFAVTPWGIAIAHTVFNILLTLLLLPFSKWLIKLTVLLLPEKNKIEEKEFFLDQRLLRSPSLAIAECEAKTLEMFLLAKKMLFSSFSLLDRYEEKTAEEILREEERVDRMEDLLGTYLVPLGSQSLSGEDSKKISKMLHTIGDFERLGDHAVNLAKAAKEISEKKISFSAPAQAELKTLRSAAEEILSLCESAYRDGDFSKAGDVEPLEQVIDGLIAQIKSNHIQRLCNGNCTIDIGFVLSDILTNYERISDHCSNIAVAMIELGHNSFDTHQYLNNVKYGNENFNKIFNAYQEKYRV